MPEVGLRPIHRALLKIVREVDLAGENFVINVGDLEQRGIQADTIRILVDGDPDIDLKGILCADIIDGSIHAKKGDFFAHCAGCQMQNPVIGRYCLISDSVLSANPYLIRIDSI